MDRRSFLKLGVTTGIATIVPINFIVDNRDAETRLLEYAICNYDEVQVVCIIKHWGFRQSKGKIAEFFAGLVQRQPEVVKWVKERIGFKKNPNGTRTCTNSEYAKYRMRPFHSAYDEWMHKEWYTVLADKFGYEKGSPYNKEWYDSVAKEIAENPDANTTWEEINAGRKKFGLI